MRQRAGTGPAWVVVAVVAALIAAPVGAVAATQLVKITGASGKVAQVDPANRLLVADSASDSFFQAGYLPAETGTCLRIFKNGPARAVLVSQIFFLVKTDPSFDANHGIIVFTEPNCAGNSRLLFSPTHLGTETFTFDPPLPVPANGALSVQAFGVGVTSEVLARGSAVPASAVP